MPSVEALDQITSDSARLVEVARSHPGAEVPQYPGWSLADLASHTGSVLGRTTIVVRTLPKDRISAPRLPDGADPIDWFEETYQEMVANLATVDPATPVWSFGSSGVLEFWINRMLVEMGVHRWDAEQALGEPNPLADTVVDVGLDEFEDLWLPQMGDISGLTVSPDDQDRVWDYLGGSTPPVAGSGSDLLLRLHGRGGYSGLPSDWEVAVDELAPPPKR